MKKLISIIAFLVMLFSVSMVSARSKSVRTWNHEVPAGAVSISDAGDYDVTIANELILEGVTTNAPSASSDIVVASSNTTLTITNNIMYLYPRLQNIIFGSTPFISTTAWTNGTSVMIVNVGTYTITIQDDNTIDSLVQTISTSTIVLSQYNGVVLTLIEGMWREMQAPHSATGITLSATLLAEQVTSTDDMLVNDQLNFGNASKYIKSGTFEIQVGTQVDAQNNLFENIGSADTDFTTGGGLTLAGDLDVNASLLLDVTAITTNGAASTQTLTATQSGYIVIAATQAITLNLPAVSGNAGLTYEVKLDSVAATAVYAVILDPNGSETIDGEATNIQIDEWYDYLKIVCDGDEWLIFAEKEH